MLAVAVVGGSAAGVLNYVNLQSLNAVEKTLIGEVPLALQASCDRNVDAERDTANVQAAVTCKSDADVNKVVFTKFTSSNTLDSSTKLT